MDDISDIRAFYSADPSGEEVRLERHRLEYDLTCRYLERYLPAEGDVLELGAATGRYTQYLAQRGHRVTAVDLAEPLLDLARCRAEAAGLAERITFLAGDARDLRHLAGERYAAALVMGPLYHLVLEADRRRVLRGVRELLAPGAPLFSAFICRWGCLGDVMDRIPDWVTRAEEVESLLTQGYEPASRHRGGFRGYFARPEEIAPLHEGEGYETLVLAAAEPAIGPYDDCYNRLGGDLRARWLDLLYHLSAEPSMLGASRHLLYVGRRR